MDRQKQMKQNKKGFTLAELLVVIAIMMILAGVSFVAINRYIRNLHVLEMDNTAKEIFIVAQNHLSQSYASGEYQREYEDHKDDFGVVLDEKPKYLSGTGDPSTNGAEPEYRYMLFTGYSEDGSGTDERTGVLSIMLPKFSIEEEIVDEGNFVIAYEVHTATVLGVFYSGKTHTYFGSSPIHDFTADEAEENGNTDLYEAREDREIRKHYKDNTVIGCYVANGKDTIPEESLKPLILHLDNGSQLTATIINPNYKADSSMILTLFVHGLTSDNTQIIQLESSGSAFNTAYNNKNGPEAASEVRSYANIGYSTDGTKEETYKFILDDVTRQNGHFCDAFKYLIPGEDVEVYAELSDTSSIAAPVKSNIETSNSLFDAFSPDSQGGIAEIGNIRHLENLDPEVSNLSFIADSSGIESSAPTLVPLISEINVKKAVQIKDLIYSGSGSFTYDISESDSSDGSTLKIYKYNGTTELSTKGYYGISNSNLTFYDGQGLNIERIHSETGANGNTGIFAETEVSDSSNPAKYFLIKNLTVNNSEFIAAANAGGFVGANLGNLRIHNCKFSVDSSVEKEVKAVGGDAGAMVGHSKGILEIINSGVTGAKLSVSSSGSDAAGLVAHSEGTLTVTNCIVKGDGLNIKSSSGDAGGIAAKCDAAAIIKSGHVIGDNIKIDAGTSDAGGILGNAAGAVTMESCSASGKKFDLKAGNAGGIIGNAAAAVDMKSSSTSGEEFTITAQRGGGIIGNADGLVTMERCSAIGRKYKITGADAGGIIGTSSGGLNINNTYCSSFIEATANAGGFIGNINAGSSNLIKNCYAAGHTKGGKYGKKPEVTDETEYYNVISAGVAGGFIGRNSVNTSVDNSYSTCSVYSSSNSATEGFAGGFVGRSTVLEVNNCYSAGPVSIKSGGTAGGFAGQGVSASGQSYYLKGKGFNASLSASGSGNVANISSTGGAEISAAGNTEDAKPWDTALSNVYPYKTVAELSEVSGTVNMHYGDWTKVEQNKLVLKIRNAEKLTAILEVPTSEISTAAGAHNYASVCVKGMSSGKIAYMQFDLLPYDIVPIGETAALYNIAASGGGDVSDADDVLFPEYTFPYDKNLVVKPVENKTQFYIDLDDITTVKKNFAAMFTGFEAGEDIRITAEWGAVSWNTLLDDAVSESSTEESDPFTGITNSLFASGSGNSNYKAKSYYSDVDPDRNIVEIGASPSAYSGMALVTNFRHLQNLDISVSAVIDSYKKAKICRNLYWIMSDASLANVYTGFINAITNGTSAFVSIYPYSATNEYDAVAVNNSFYGIVNNRITDFDGNGHSINNMLISNGNSDGSNNEQYSAGLFRVMDINSSEPKSIHDLSIVQSVIVSRNGYAGGLIGYLSSSGILNIDNVFIYGKDALVRAIFDKDNGNNGTDAGGFIGCAVDGGYNVSNCGSSSYVYAEDKAICAGGFIGDFKPKKTTTFTNCFVGGHINSSQDYVADYAVSGDSNIISANTEGGYNIYGQTAVGGFFGYVGTKAIDGGLTITNCFTTASVYCEKSKSNGGAVGGFVGQMQHEKQKYSSCYMEGKVYPGTACAGTFIGDYYKPQSGDNPRFENVYVLTGLNFNDDTNLNDVAFSHNAVTITGITRVDYDSSDIVNQNADQVRTEKFNKTPVDAKFPYKDNTMQGLEYVFYGDWVEPAKLVPVLIKNSNRLIASIELRDETRGIEYLDGQAYYVTYIRVKGTSNGIGTIFRVFYNDSGIIYKTQRSRGTWISWEDMSNSAMVLSGTKLDFYMDDISRVWGSYSSTVFNSIPGENITVYVSRSLETEGGINGVKSDDAFHDTGNSLFEKIEKNSDGDNTYTAYISNSRNLLNLDTRVSGVGAQEYKITRAVQTDDIFWQDNGINLNTSRTTAYLTEINKEANNEVNIYAWSEIQPLSSLGSMYPISTIPYLKEYDGYYNGKVHTIYNLNLGPSSSSGNNSGLFGKISSPMTIKNLYITNPTANSGASSGAVVGWVASDLTMSNVYVNGNVNIYGKDSGGVIGYVGTGSELHDLVLDNVAVFASSGSIQGCSTTCSDGSLGGLIGRIKLTNLDIRNSFSSVGVMGNGYGVGGFVGCLADNNCTGTISKCYSSGYTNSGIGLNSVVGGLCTGIGGFVGIATGNVSIQNCFSTCYITSTCNVDGSYWFDFMGGFIGIAADRVKIKDNCYTIGRVTPGPKNSSYHGIFAGKIYENAVIENSYYINRFNSLLDPIAVNGNGSVVNNDYDPEHEINLQHILGNSSEGTLSSKTTHHDLTYPTETCDYPYKNWTNSSPDQAPVFYGDW
ncbi:prepilin-type N-terminal cleavage/methylation domain-containing protein [Lachnospiraceae bacterium JC7]|nr:prepilin-type N-terminal cleavage/methylation domain-containing protein [Lachnospiraceae bacterium JC7]